MEVRLLAVTSFVRDRGRAIGVVAALTATVALASAPAAFGAVDGDPIASATFNVNFSSGQLRQNGVKIKPKKLTLTKGDVDPITGAADLSLGKITFKKGNKKLVYSNVKASLPGTLKGSSGKLFKLTSGTAARLGFGASITGVKVKFLKSATKKLNKKLGLHSLHPGIAGTLSLSYQPKTVHIVSGEAIVSPNANLAPGSGTVASKLASHCIDALFGVVVIPPATTGGIGQPFHFPVNGGTVSPAGNDGVLQAQGGVRLMNGKSAVTQPVSCPNVAPGVGTSTALLEQTNLATNLGLLNIQSDVFLGGTNPPNVLGGPGPKGIAIGQVIDGSKIKVDDANPTTHHIKISGALIKNNAVSSQTLNLFFPNQSGNSGQDFVDGDLFGTAVLDVTVR
jgi:hypothetical protein